MSRVKNISGGPLDVPILGRQVEDGEEVDVPDTQDDGSAVVWPSNRWQPVTASRKKESEQGAAD